MSWTRKPGQLKLGYFITSFYNLCHHFKHRLLDFFSPFGITQLSQKFCSVQAVRPLPEFFQYYMLKHRSSHLLVKSQFFRFQLFKSFDLNGLPLHKSCTIVLSKPKRNGQIINYLTVTVTVKGVLFIKKILT